MEKKYEFTDETIIFLNHRLHRIRALKDFGKVKKGDLGGYVESEENLSQDGNCWVSGNAWVYDNAKISGDAEVYENAEVYEHAEVSGYAQVFGKSRVFGKTRISGSACIFAKAQVFGNAQVYGNVWLSGKALVYDNAQVSGGADIYGTAQVYGNARVSADASLSSNAYISSNNDYLTIHGLGSENRTTTFYKTKDDKIFVQCGCFNGSISEFRERVKETHGDTLYAKEYLQIADLAEEHILRKGGK